MQQVDLDSLKTKAAETGRISDEEARAIMSTVYGDGVISRDEAEAMFALNDTLSGANRFWDERFCEAIKDFLLTVEAPVGWITKEESDWLKAMISKDGRIGLATELDLLLNVLRYAEGAPAELGLYTLSAISDYAKAQSYVDASTVERLRRALYAAAGDGAVWVTRKEAVCLFDLNDVVFAAENDPSWNDLFARAIGNHVMAAAHPNPQSEEDAFAREKWLQESSSGLGGFFASMAGSLSDGSWLKKAKANPAAEMREQYAEKEAIMRDAETVNTEEENWLINRIGWDKKVTPAEQALIAFLKKEAPGFAADIVSAA